MSGKHRPNEPQGTFEVIDRALTGHRSLVMLWDGSGVGKTRLAMEITRHTLEEVSSTSCENWCDRLRLLVNMHATLLMIELALVDVRSMTHVARPAAHAVGPDISSWRISAKRAPVLDDDRSAVASVVIDRRHVAVAWVAVDRRHKGRRPKATRCKN
jgi:hypothetical protein